MLNNGEFCMKFDHFSGGAIAPPLIAPLLRIVKSPSKINSLKSSYIHMNVCTRFFPYISMLEYRIHSALISVASFELQIPACLHNFVEKNR